MSWRTVLFTPHAYTARRGQTCVGGRNLSRPARTRPPFRAPGDDIIDEVLGFFKANVLFKQFQPAGPADRVLVYLTLYTTQALAKCVTCENAPAALKALTAMAHENFKIPGDSTHRAAKIYPWSIPCDAAPSARLVAPRAQFAHIRFA